MATTEQMNLEIQEAIKKSLPNQVGEALKQKIEQADKDAKLVVSQADEINSKAEHINNLTLKINEYQRLDERNSKLNEREKAVEDAERNKKVFEAELKLAEAEKRITENVNFVSMVFKSPIFRKTILEPSYGTYNNQNMFSTTGGGLKTETSNVE